MSDVIKFVRAELKITDKVSIDCYLMPDGEKRVGITGAALATERSKEYLSRLVAGKGGKSLKALKAKGFQGCIKEGLVERKDGRGSPIAKTISVSDFVKYVTFEATHNQRVEAIVLLAAFAEVGLERTIDLLFAGESTQFIFEKVVHYTQWTNNDLREALAYNYEDRQEIEEQLAFVGEF